MFCFIRKTGVPWIVAACIFFCSSAAAQNINRPNKTGPLGTQVNTFSGNLFIPRTDIYMPSRGMDITLSFFYNSFLSDEHTGFGAGWTNSYDIYYRNDTSNAKVIVWGDGSEDIYTASGSNFTSPPGTFNAFTQYQPNKFLLTQPDGIKFYFDNNVNKKITKMQDRSGNFLNFSYTDSLLTAITNAVGQTISLSYNSDGNLATVTDGVASPVRVYQYQYDGAGNLVQVTDPLGGKMKYTYLINGPMKTMTDKNNNLVDIIYYPDFTVNELIGCNKRMSFSYDTSLHVCNATDYIEGGANRITKYTYQLSGNFANLVAMTSNCCGFNMAFQYDGQGNKIKSTDANGNSTLYTYDSQGNMLTMTDPLNQTTTWTWSSGFDRMLSVKDPKGAVTVLSYDAVGHLTGITEPGNLSYTASYAANGDILTSTDPAGNSYQYNYDAYGAPTSVTGPNNYHAVLAFDARGNLMSYTDPRNNTSNASYDILNRLTTLTLPDNSNVNYTYDAAGNVTVFTNQNNEQRHIAYDASNRPVKVINESGNSNTISYDAMDNIVGLKNALGNKFSLSFDPRNRLSGTTDALGNQTSFSYDGKGNLKSFSAPNGQNVTYNYDNDDRLISASDQTGILGTITYDQNDNVTSFTNGIGATTTAVYDGTDRLTGVTDPLGNSITVTYDANGNVASGTDRNGHTRHYTYDGRNRILTSSDNNSHTITYTYDAADNITAVKDQDNNITSYTYDSQNRLFTTTYPDGKFIQLGYNLKGNVVTKKIPDGTTIYFTYDSLNHIISKTLPDGRVFTYSYDAAGRLQTAANNSGIVTFTYDALDRIVSESFDGRTTSYSYNTSGRIQSTTYPDGTVITKSFDTRNRMTGLSKGSNNVVTYLYDNAGHLTHKAFANGRTTDMQYDFANRLSNLNTGNIQSTTFSYDNEYQKTAANHLNNSALSETYIYDNAHRLVDFKKGATENTYTYDALGNRTAATLNGTAVSYSVNSLNQPTSSSSSAQNISFTYDNNGNLTYDGRFYKNYDAEGRLLKDSSSPANVLQYYYDALSRRVKKVYNGVPLKYSYSGSAQIEERDGITGNLRCRTIYNNFLTPVLNELNNSRYYYHQNEINSVEALTDSAGNLIETYRYDVYGKPSVYNSGGTQIAWSLTGNRFGFTGQEYDSANADYHFNLRNYDPSTGVFVQRDPIGYADNMGMYQYVDDNPANGIDIFGLDCSHQETYSFTKDVTEDYTFWFGEYSNISSIITWSKWASNNKLLGNFVNNPIFGLITMPANVMNTINPLIDTWEHGRTNSNAQNIDNVLSSASSGATTVTGAWGSLAFLGGVTESALTGGNLFAGGMASSSAAFSAEGVGASGLVRASIPVAGVLAAYGLLNWEVSKITHGEASGILQFADKVSYDHWYNQYKGDAEYELFKFYESQGRLKDYFRIMDRHKQIEETAQRTVADPNCPQNQNPAGTQKKKFYHYEPNGDSTEIVQAHDPNLIIGPVGVPQKAWVSVHDRLPYTILFENSKSASAPAKFVRVTSPIEPKEDANTFQLGSFGFNNQTFNVPNNAASFYQRIDARDSLGLFVDVTAGYNQVGGQAFWEFQSIDPVTLLPPSDPLKGFLLLQDSSKGNAGHGFVNFSMKPKQAAVTLDTIGARAAIVFDTNDTIPTNIAKNTIDAFAPTSHMNVLPATSNNPVPLSWGGTDDPGGCGVWYYTLYVSTDGVNYNIIRSNITRTDTTFTGTPNTSYSFFVLATDSVGNTEVLRAGEVKSTFIGAVVPVTWLHFSGITEGKDNLLNWSTATEQNSREFKIERSLNANTFTAIGTQAAAGNSTAVRDYTYRDRNIDLLKAPAMYYRIKQIDIDGNFRYSNIVRLTYDQKGTTPSIVYPNPTQGLITVTIGDPALIGTEAVLTDVNGRLLEQVKITGNSVTINLGKYVDGTYYIRLSNKEVLKVVRL